MIAGFAGTSDGFGNFHCFLFQYQFFANVTVASLMGEKRAPRRPAFTLKAGLGFYFFIFLILHKEAEEHYTTQTYPYKSLQGENLAI